MNQAECDALLAIAGYDVAYIMQVNKALLRGGLSCTVTPPSGSTDVLEYMRSAADVWRKQLAVALKPDPILPRPFVTVIFTTFSPKLELFELSLQSILVQEGVEIEVIVIDDCSPIEVSRELESRLDALREHCNKSIVYRRNRVNLGQYESRNVALALATGDFIAIQDDDDISNPQRLIYQVQVLLKSPQLRATCAQHLRISENSHLMADGATAGAIEGDAPVSFVWRKEVFSDLGGFLPTRTRGDIEFRARMIRAFSDESIEIIPLPLVLMRGGMATVSSDSEYTYRSAVSALRYMMDHLPTKADHASALHRWIPNQLRS